MLTDFIERIPVRYWVIALLVVWGGISLFLLRHDAYGLDEGAARALLLNWSVVDNVANPVVTFGVPDFRALFFIPLGMYWSGNLMAAKVFTLLIAFAAAVLLYQWRERVAGKEVALIATGLLLICPVTLLQIDSLGAGPYLLALFAYGALLDQSYRAIGPPLGGKYFTQMVLVAAVVTLHPAGLAYPVALAWGWYKNPVSARNQKYMYLGMAIALAFISLLCAGWHGLEYWSNPVTALQSAIFGPAPSDTSIAGVFLAIILVVVTLVNRRRLLEDLMGTMLLFALILGALAADLSWAMLAVVIVIYYGISSLIRLNESLGGTDFLRQRGGVMLVIVIVATVFMNVDKGYYSYTQAGLLSARDELIRTLALDAADTAKPFRAASQWPARTMIVVKRDVLPLPPAAKDPETLLKMIPGITHIMFDPYNGANLDLARNISQLSGVLETLAPQPGGVIVRMRTHTE